MNRTFEVAQILVSLFTLVVHLVVECKPKYDQLATKENSRFSIHGSFIDLHALCRCLFSGSPPAWYYFGYSLFCILIQTVYPPLCPFLLLDVVVKSRTTSHVLLAIYRPLKQIIATMCLLVFSVYIFSSAYFFSYRLELKDDDSVANDCDSLRRCFLSAFTRGMRNTGGFGDQFSHSVDSNRTAVDFLFFYVVLVVLVNIFSGIIIGIFKRKCFIPFLLLFFLSFQISYRVDYHIQTPLHIFAKKRERGYMQRPISV